MGKPTRAQILAEPPGREMDRLVAEFVMGDTLLRYPSENHVPRWYNNLTNEFSLPYSRDVKMAMLVVDRIANRMWRMVWLPDAKLWQVGFIDESPVNEIETVTMPLGVCRCALLAVIGEA